MSAGTAIAIDLGGTQLRVALVEGNRLLDRAALPTDTAAGPAGIFGQIDQLIDELINKMTGQKRLDITGIGMSCAGPINTDTGTVTDIPTLPGWNGFRLPKSCHGAPTLPFGSRMTASRRRSANGITGPGGARATWSI
jgi:glucokinase